MARNNELLWAIGRLMTRALKMKSMNPSETSSTPRAIPATRATAGPPRYQRSVQSKLVGPARFLQPPGRRRPFRSNGCQFNHMQWSGSRWADSPTWHRESLKTERKAHRTLQKVAVSPFVHVHPGSHKKRIGEDSRNRYATSRKWTSFSLARLIFLVALVTSQTSCSMANRSPQKLIGESSD